MCSGRRRRKDETKDSGPTHAECVTGELRNLLHRRVAPDDDLVLRLPGREPVRRDELVRVFAEQHVADLSESHHGRSVTSASTRREIKLFSRNGRGCTSAAHLTAGIDLLEQVAGQGVPEPQLLIGRSASAGEDTMLMRIPSDRFDGCDVIREAMQRGLAEVWSIQSERESAHAHHSARVRAAAGERRGEKSRTSDILSNTKSLLSLPPLASWLSSLHLSPHTSCRCTASLLTQWFLIRTSRW